MAESRTLTLALADPAATARLGHAVAEALARLKPLQFCIYLEGELGAGKTAFARAVLAGLGYPGRVPSPTYTLVEPYTAGGFEVLHADLYRLQDPAELEALGIAEQFGAGCLLLVEWPAQGRGRLPPPDLEIRLSIVEGGRQAAIGARSMAGARLLDLLPLGPLGQGL